MDDESEARPLLQTLANVEGGGGKGDGDEDGDGGLEMDVEFDCKACDPTHLSHRVIFLILICFLSFGSYFVYDNPAALQNQFLSDMDINQSQFMLMYAVYSWPNVILCFFGGYLMDKVIGLRLGALIFSGLVLLGQIVVALGASANSYPMVLAGRFIFGLGGENLAVAQNTYAVSWFKGKELNFVFGLQLSFSRVGSTVNMITMKPIYDLVGNGKGGHGALAGALWVGAMFCGLSVVTAILAGWLDKRAERLTKQKSGEVGEEINFSDVLKFPLKFWLMCVICVAYYVTIFPFIGLALVFFQDKWGMTQSQASTLNSLVYIISAVASPVFGGLIDGFGRNMYWVMGAVALTLGCHLMLALTFITPYAAIVTMGIAYSALASSLWPMVAFVIPENQLGTAYGFMQAVQNLGLAVIAMMAGMIVDTKGYLWLSTFFVAWLSVALMSAVWLYMLDTAGNGELNMTAAQRKAMVEEEERDLTRAKLEALKEPPPEPTLLRPKSNFELRNRYMSRIGMALDNHVRDLKTRFTGPQPLH